MMTFVPLFTASDGTLLPFEVAVVGQYPLMTINPAGIAYLRPGSDSTRTRLAFIGSPDTLVEIYCSYADLSTALRGWQAWATRMSER